MTSSQIKDECGTIYDTIKLSEDRLKELRAICTHEETFEGDYSWRIGASNRATICSICGVCVKMLFPKTIITTAP